jgi:cytochrome c biogenesis protein CcmG/thiol:disulfide interchange protein DsbE
MAPKSDKEHRGPTPLRWAKLLTMLLTPTLGFVYAFQYYGQERSKVVPFESFQAPQVPVFQNGASSEKIQIKFGAPITVLNFWASWCEPCVKEFPAMLELKRNLEGKGVEFKFVSINEKWSDVDDFIEKYSIPIEAENMFWDPKQEASTAWGSMKFPETFVVRRDGWVVEKIIGLQNWTRPAVYKYFVELGERFKDLKPKTQATASLMALFLSEVQAADNVLGTEMLIHDADKKTLEKMRKNIETANKNLQETQAANREEGRNLNEQKVILERKVKDQKIAEDDLAKIESKVSDVKVLIEKTRDSEKVETLEKQKIESQIKGIKGKIADLERRLESSKEELNQATKSLNSRAQNIETTQKAQESSNEELVSLKSKSDKARQLVSEKRSETSKAESEIRKREKKLSEIVSQERRAEATLADQKKKLEEFEQLLRK